MEYSEDVRYVLVRLDDEGMPYILSNRQSNNIVADINKAVVEGRTIQPDQVEYKEEWKLFDMSDDGNHTVRIKEADVEQVIQQFKELKKKLPRRFKGVNIVADEALWYYSNTVNVTSRRLLEEYRDAENALKNFEYNKSYLKDCVILKKEKGKILFFKGYSTGFAVWTQDFLEAHKFQGYQTAQGTVNTLKIPKGRVVYVDDMDQMPPYTIYSDLLR